MNTRRVKRKSKASYTEKINTHAPSGWCVYSTFAYGDASDPLKMYQDKDCVEEFVEYKEEEVKWLYATFPQQPMTELTTRHQKRVTFASKSLMTQRIKR